MCSKHISDISLSEICLLTIFRMGLFGAAHGWEAIKNAPLLFWKSVTHILQWWNFAHLYLDQRRSKKYMITWRTPWVLMISAFFHWKSGNFAMPRNVDIACISRHNFYFFNFIWIFRDCFNKHGYNFNDISKNDYSRPS